VPLNPEEWTAADDADGFNAEELDACIDLLEDDEDEQQQQQDQQQQQRSGGRRRRPLYDAAAGDGSDQDQAQVGHRMQIQYGVPRLQQNTP